MSVPCQTERQKNFSVLPVFFEKPALLDKTKSGGQSTKNDRSRPPGDQTRRKPGAGGQAAFSAKRRASRNKLQENLKPRPTGRTEAELRMRNGMHEIFLPAKFNPMLASGHPWMYRDHVPGDISLSSGTWVKIFAGQASAFGLWDSSGPIAVRIFSWKTLPTLSWVEERVKSAAALRSALFLDPNTDCFRLLYGEGDGLPGVVVDLYGGCAVIKTYADSISAAMVPWIVSSLQSLSAQGVIPVTSIVHRRGNREASSSSESDSDSDTDEASASPDKVKVLWGPAPSTELVVTENGMRMKVDIYNGQKTGLFLDQRENRQAVASLCRGQRVLNLFSYNGGFSLAAALAGAKQVTSVDIARPAIQDAIENFKLNGLDPQQHEFLARDAYEHMQECIRQGRQFDVVVIDPPSLAHNKSQRFAAIRAYTRLNTAAIRCARPGGLIVSSSCTAQVSAIDFREMLAAASAGAKRRLQILNDSGHALDHPVLPHFIEGRYLKFVVARVNDIP